MDRWVNRWSSHPEDAALEKVVDYGHAVFRHPDGTAEIERVLKLPRRRLEPACLSRAGGKNLNRREQRQESEKGCPAETEGL